MIIPDVNLLLYAYDSSSSCHARAVDWWEACLSGSERIGLPHVVLFGFIRVGTHARVFREPLTPAEATRHVRAWLEQPVVEVLPPDSDHLLRTLTLLESLGTAANLVSDAQLAALAIHYGAVLHTADADFVRFPGLRWFNPLTGTGTHRIRRSKLP